MFLLLLLVLPAFGVNVTVVTTQGSIIGEENDGLNTFFGVPYAKVNEDRPFEDTSEYHFKEFYASDPTIKCPQLIPEEGGTIQCLRLNVYAPTNHTKELPVFVWFHGGGFVMGSAGQYTPKSLTKLGVIVVTANYRLGVYGFICVDGIENQGLKDQRSALRWIKANIGAFGGDADNITVGGQSYGGGAVDFHLYSNEVLFNKAIIESGSKFASGIRSNKDNESPIIIAKELGSDANETDKAMKFLNIVNPIEVMRATNKLNLRFGICESKKLISTPNLTNTTILIGYNSKEDFARFATQNETFYASLEDIFQTSLNEILHGLSQNLLDIVKRFYLGGKDISKEAMLELVDFSSDFKLNYAVERSVNNYLDNKAKVYKYLFSYTRDSPYKNITGVGAYHTEELRYIFDGSSDTEHSMMKKRMITMWANFIKFGDPIPSKTKLLPVIWTPVNMATRPYLDINEKLVMRQHLYHQRMAFWDLLSMF